MNGSLVGAAESNLLFIRAVSVTATVFMLVISLGTRRTCSIKGLR